MENRPTDDWDQASSAVCNAYFPHRLHPQASSTAANVAVDSADLGPIRIAHINWGATVSIETEHPSGYAINAPLTGHLESRVRGGDLIATPTDATIYPPDTPAHITRWTKSCVIVGVRVEPDFLHREMSRVLGRPVPVPDHLDLTASAGADWLRLVQSLSASQFSHSLVIDALCGAIAASLILAVAPEEEAWAPRPRIVKRLLDRMHDDPTRPWTGGEMADVSGVSLRRVQEGFRQYVGVSPRECLLDIRLERVRDELRRAETPCTVTEIAMRWGFTHTGRFAMAYRRKYGESPSQTLHA